MPYTKAQLRAYWATNKALLNHQRRERRRLAKLGLAEKVSHAEVSHNQVSQIEPLEVSQVKKVSHLVKAAKPVQVSHEKVSHSAQTANPEKVSHQEVSRVEVSHEKVSQKEVSHKRAYSKTANPQLADLIQAWQTGTNYACAFTCLTTYCSNCWYFSENKLIDYKSCLLES